MAIEPPVAPGAGSPGLVATAEGAALTWVEPVVGPASGHRVRFARFAKRAWTAATTISEGPRILASAVDVPSVARQDNGVLVAHWAEASAGARPQGYDVVLARSIDAGATWRRLGVPHRDGVDAEHGFVSLVPDGDAALAVWLDGRAASGPAGATALRAARVGEALGEERVIDDRVCDCCTTSGVATPDGPVIAYRDRTADELRDPWVARRLAGAWSAPRAVHVDGWRITGCPVNGPRLAAAGREVAVAWFTHADKPRVRIAFSADGGATFEPPIAIDEPDGQRVPLGRVDVVLERAGEALVSWSTADADDAQLRIRRVTRDRRRGAPLEVVQIPGGRAGGAPRMVRVGDELVLAWADPKAKTVRAALLPLSQVPAVSTIDRSAE